MSRQQHLNDIDVLAFRLLGGVARQCIAETGADRVNVIAHSKGGLDSRYAMWTNPELFKFPGHARNAER